MKLQIIFKNVNMEITDSQNWNYSDIYIFDTHTVKGHFNEVIFRFCDSFTVTSVNDEL